MNKPLNRPTDAQVLDELQKFRAVYEKATGDLDKAAALKSADFAIKARIGPGAKVDAAAVSLRKAARSFVEGVTGSFDVRLKLSNLSALEQNHSGQRIERRSALRAR